MLVTLECIEIIKLSRFESGPPNIQLDGSALNRWSGGAFHQWEVDYMTVKVSVIGANILFSIMGPLI